MFLTISTATRSPAAKPPGRRLRIAWGHSEAPTSAADREAAVIVLVIDSTGPHPARVP